MGVGGRAVYRLGVLRRGVLRTPKDAWRFWDGTHIDLFPTFRLGSPTLMSRVGFQADVAAATSSGCTALHCAAWIGDYDAVASQQLQANANVHAVSNYGQTALHWAARNGRARVADVLLQANASTTAVTMAGRTPVQVAEQNGHGELAERLRQAQRVGGST